MAKIMTRRWDAAEHLQTDDEMAAYLEAALEEGDPVKRTIRPRASVAPSRGQASRRRVDRARLSKEHEGQTLLPSFAAKQSEVKTGGEMPPV